MDGILGWTGNQKKDTDFDHEVCRGSGGMDNASSTVDNFADRIWI